jgi:hypothetical protein
MDSTFLILLFFVLGVFSTTGGVLIIKYSNDISKLVYDYYSRTISKFSKDSSDQESPVILKWAIRIIGIILVVFAIFSLCLVVFNLLVRYAV